MGASRPHPAGPNLSYRPDIDGLRTLAVVPVVLFHAGISAMSGGYVGVDIFFVISGYLITGIITASLARQTFTIADFYRRRVRRIFPALALVLAIGTLMAAAFMAPVDFINYGKSLASITVFGSNFHFWKSVDYFSNAAHVQPLLHTWSLAVEEQFYIFYPPLLWALARFRLPVVPILLGACVLSFLASAVLLGRMPGAVFYLVPFRAWELGIGGLVALGWPGAPKRAQTAQYAGLLGLVMMVLPIVLYQPDTPFPGLAAAPPTLGAALVIWSGQLASGPAYRLLATRPFVAIGKVSYSFYLWHFVIFSMIAYIGDRALTAGLGLFLSAIALGAAFLTLWLVEAPIRHNRSSWSIWGPVATIAGLGVIGLTIGTSNGFPGRFDAHAVAIDDIANDKGRHPSRCMSSGNTIFPPEKACLLGYPQATPHTLLMGDSHAMVTATAMAKVAQDRHGAFLFAASADCPPGLGFTISPRFQPGLTTAPAYRFCADYNRRMFDLARNNPAIRNVVISSRWSNWRIGEPGNAIEQPVDIRLADATGTAGDIRANAAIFERGFDRLVTDLLASGKQVWIVGPVPEPDFDVPHRMFVARYHLAEAPEALSMHAFEQRHAHALAILGRLPKDNRLHFIWPHLALCSKQDCPIMKDQLPLYLDHNHLSIKGAQITSPLYSSLFSETGQR